MYPLADRKVTHSYSSNTAGWMPSVAPSCAETPTKAKPFPNGWAVYHHLFVGDGLIEAPYSQET